MGLCRPVVRRFRNTKLARLIGLPTPMEIAPTMAAEPGMPTVVDHLFALLLVVGVPLYAARFSWPRMKKHDLAEAEPAARIRIYWGVMGPEWLLAVVTLAIWVYGQRPWAELGFGLQAGWRLWTGLGAAAVVE